MIMVGEVVRERGTNDYGGGGGERREGRMSMVGEVVREERDE